MSAGAAQATFAARRGSRAMLVSLLHSIFPVFLLLYISLSAVGLGAGAEGLCMAHAHPP